MQSPVGQRLKEARKYINFNQEQLAEAINVTQSAISLAERDGSISNELATYMSKSHKINLNWLFTGEGEMLIRAVSGSVRELEEKIIELQGDVEKYQDELLTLYREKAELERALKRKSG